MLNILDDQSFKRNSSPKLCIPVMIHPEDSDGDDKRGADFWVIKSTIIPMFTKCIHTLRYLYTVAQANTLQPV